jgi:galactosamine-6-phosphate isomerase
MKLIRCAGYEPMSRAAAECITDVLAHKRDAVLCAAAGNSPTGLYRELARAAQKDPDRFAAVRIVKLDDWLGVPPDHPANCEHYVRSNVVEPLRIDDERYLGFRPDAADPSQECGRVQTELDRCGLDVCILGLGANGHIGLNEPAPSLEVGCHVALLTEESRKHALLADVHPKPTHGLTLGIGDILRARKIVLLITGRGKERAVSGLLSGQLTTAVPASLLALHDDVDVFIDDSSVTAGT